MIIFLAICHLCQMARDCFVHLWNLVPHQDPGTKYIYNMFFNETNTTSHCNMAICEWISLLGCWSTNGTGLTKVEVAHEKLAYKDGSRLWWGVTEEGLDRLTDKFWFFSYWKSKKPLKNLALGRKCHVWCLMTITLVLVNGMDWRRELLGLSHPASNHSSKRKWEPGLGLRWWDWRRIDGDRTFCHH